MDSRFRGNDYKQNLTYINIFKDIGFRIYNKEAANWSPLSFCNQIALIFKIHSIHCTVINADMNYQINNNLSNNAFNNNWKYWEGIA